MKIIAVNIDDIDVEDVSSLNIVYKGDSPIRDGMPFFIPPFSEHIGARLSFAVKLKRVGKFIATRFASRYYNEYTFALDLTAKDVLQNLKDRGYSCSIASSFENSSAFGKWQDLDNVNNISVEIIYNDKCIFKVNRNIREYLRLIEEVIMYISQYYMLKIGDIIILSFMGINIDKLFIGDNIKIIENDKEILDLKIK